MDPIYRSILELEKNGRQAAVCTIVATHGSTPRHAGSKMLVYEDGESEGSIGGGKVETLIRDKAMQAIQARQVTRIIAGIERPEEPPDLSTNVNAVEIFIEPINHTRRLLVIGAGHVGRALLHLAKWVGFSTLLMDDREDTLLAEKQPDADRRMALSAQTIEEVLKTNPNLAVVLVTRDSTIDLEVLPVILRQACAYVGVIGSRSRWANTCILLEKEGVSRDDIDRVHSPVGLSIGAETPEEIALSILSEIMMETTKNK